MLLCSFDKSDKEWCEKSKKIFYANQSNHADGSKWMKEKNDIIKQEKILISEKWPATTKRISHSLDDIMI